MFLKNKQTKILGLEIEQMRPNAEDTKARPCDKLHTLLVITCEHEASSGQHIRISADGVPTSASPESTPTAPFEALAKVPVARSKTNVPFLFQLCCVLPLS